MHMEKIHQLAHSFYSTFCCGEKDCFPVNCSELIKQGAGYVYHGILSEATTEFHTSPDLMCHICVGNHDATWQFLRCIWLPLGIS